MKWVIWLKKISESNFFFYVWFRRRRKKSGSTKLLQISLALIEEKKHRDWFKLALSLSLQDCNLFWNMIFHLMPLCDVATMGRRFSNRANNWKWEAAPINNEIRDSVSLRLARLSVGYLVREWETWIHPRCHCCAVNGGGTDRVLSIILKRFDRSFISILFNRTFARLNSVV